MVTKDSFGTHAEHLSWAAQRCTECTRQTEAGSACCVPVQDWFHDEASLIDSRYTGPDPLLRFRVLRDIFVDSPHMREFVCDACRDYIEEILATARKSLWAELPAYFGLTMTQEGMCLTCWDAFW
jgi:hypothetical protein